MMGLSEGRKGFQIGLAVSIQYRRVISSQPPSQPRRRSKDPAYYVTRVKTAISVENRHFHPMYLTRPLQGFPLEFCIGARGQNTRMIGLPYGRKSFKMGLAVQTQYWRLTDRHPAIRPSFDSKDRTYVLRRAGKNPINYNIISHSNF